MSQPFLYRINRYKAALPEELVAGQHSILRTLAYFDIFHYPLTCDEIREFLGEKFPEPVFLECLRQLLEDGKIFFFNNVYSLQDNPLLQHKRQQGNQRAERLLVKAKRTGRFLYQFPFVSAVAISGSLSKNYADEKADFDFFIITRSGRMWVARTIMHLYKKLTFLTGRQHHYCMNYYIDEEALHIGDQNIFTAIEMKTLLPVAGENIVNQFFEINRDWTERFLPAGKFRKMEIKDPDHSVLKKVLQKLTGFTALDNFLHRLTERRWNRKEKKGKKNQKGITMGLHCGKHFARANPGNFQEKLLMRYSEKLKNLL